MNPFRLIARIAALVLVSLCVYVCTNKEQAAALGEWMRESVKAHGDGKTAYPNGY